MFALNVHGPNVCLFQVFSLSATNIRSGGRRQLCRLERTRISHYATLDTPANAAFIKESRMEFANAAGLSGKSGVA